MGSVTPRRDFTYGPRTFTCGITAWAENAGSGCGGVRRTWTAASTGREGGTFVPVCGTLLPPRDGRRWTRLPISVGASLPYPLKSQGQAMIFESTAN